MKTSALVLGTLFSCFGLLSSHQSQLPIETMADITNDFGVCVLQLLASPNSNAVVSPYGLVSVALLLYEGSNGVSAAEFYNTLHLPWNRDITRLGFRDLHNYLKSYFTSDGFLRGLILNRSNITLRSEYISILQFYGFQADAPFTQSPNTTVSSTTSMMTTNETTTASTSPTTTPSSTTPSTTTPSTTTPSTTTPSTTTPSTTTPSTTTPSTTTPSTTTPTESTTSSTTQTGSTPSREIKEMISEVSTSQILTSSPTLDIETAEAVSTALQSATEKMLNSMQEINISTATLTQELDTNPIASTQESTTSSEVLTQDVVTSPIASTQEVNTIPITSTQDVNTSPIASTQEPSTIPVDSTQQVITSPIASTQEVNTIPVTSTQDVNTSPIASTQESSTIPVDSTQQVITGPIASTQEVNTISITSTQDVNTSPGASAQEITTSATVTVKSDVPENTINNITETMTSIPEGTVSLEGTSSNEDSFKPSSRIVSITSDIQSTKFFSPSSPVESFQEINDRTTTSIDSGELLTSPFVSETTGALLTTSNVDDILIMSPPPDPDIIPFRDMPMLEAIMLGLNRETLLEPLSTVSLNILSSTGSETTEENLLTKRSTIDTEMTNSQINPETITDEVGYSEPMTSTMSDNTMTMVGVPLNPSTTLDVTGSNEKPLNVNHSSTHDFLAETVAQENDSFTQSTISSLTGDQENIKTSNFQQSETTSSNEVNVLHSDNVADLSLLTILSDSITFPNKSRQKRSIYGYERNIQYGNWISHSRRAPWFQSPGEQWFSTYSGKILTPMLTYTAYLPFTYISSIGASALELPLDDVRYSLLILLPNQNRGLKDMLYSLKHCPLRYIVTRLKHTPVYAVVPVFTIVKHINLTPVLQVLGISKVFDAFQANLTNMSDEANLYVRSIEQVITVSVRKYYSTSKWINASPSQIERHFVATRPFAFFVIDSLSKVSLLAGSIVNPLSGSS